MQRFVRKNSNSDLRVVPDMKFVSLAPPIDGLNISILKMNSDKKIKIFYVGLTNILYYAFTM